MTLEIQKIYCTHFYRTQVNLHYMLVKFGTNVSGATCWSNFELIQVEPHAWVRCASGNNYLEKQQTKGEHPRKDYGINWDFVPQHGWCRSEW